MQHHQPAGLPLRGHHDPAGRRDRCGDNPIHRERQPEHAVSVRIYGQAADNSATFTTTAFNITGRPKTTAFVDWAIPAFTASARTAAQQTPDLTTIIQEVVDRPAWTSGNAIAFMLAYLSGGGQRSLVTWDDGLLTEATLTVTYLQDAPTDLGYLVTDYLLSGYFTS